MRKVIIALMFGVACLFADDSLKVVPHVKAEFLGIQQIDTGVGAGSVVLGDNNFGLTATKGNLEVVGSVSFVDSPEFGVDINKIYLTKGLGESLNLTIGYKDLPYGFWLTNCVNYPLVRSGDFNSVYDSYVIKTKASQIDLTWKNGMIITDVAGYMHNGKFNSAVAKSEMNFGDIIALNASIKIQNIDTLSIVCGTTANMGKFQLTGVYSRGITAENTGAYAEISIFPTDINVTSIRGDILLDSKTHSGLSSYSLSTLFFLTENFYTGMEYNLKSDILDSELQKPTHWVTGLIGVEF